jgi:dTDP-4-dehydrorhamnose 3,5-epimerase-like enzyme
MFERQIIKLNVHTDGRGNLTAVESNIDAPFEIKRVYYMYGIPDGQDRGAHAHKELEQLVIAVAGSFEIVLDDGQSVVTTVLDDPAKALYVPRMNWRTLQNFSKDAVCLVLASALYNEADYYRSYEEFKSALNA